MANNVFSLFEPNFENVTSDLTRLDGMYSEKRKSESEIEGLILKVDQMAMEELKSSEEELKEVNLKCAAIIARLKRAAGGTLPGIFCV